MFCGLFRVRKTGRQISRFRCKLLLCVAVFIHVIFILPAGLFKWLCGKNKFPHVTCYLSRLCCSVHEKKCISRGESVAPASQSKLSRVSSGFGLSKLTGVRRNKKENSLNKNSLSAQVRTQPPTPADVHDIQLRVCHSLVFLIRRRLSSGCSHTSLLFETWWPCSTKNIKRYLTYFITRWTE